jgi:hypothetical protein
LLGATIERDINAGKTKYYAWHIVVTHVYCNLESYAVDYTRYTFEELLQETELIKVDYKHWKAKNKQSIYRSGMPQGLPLSPLAATIALENVIEMPELTLYADDGILIGGKDKFKEFVKKSIEVGAEIAPEKTKIVGDSFKFLGVVINIKERRVESEDS